MSKRCSHQGHNEAQAGWSALDLAASTDYMATPANTCLKINIKESDVETEEVAVVSKAMQLAATIEATR